MRAYIADLLEELLFKLERYQLRGYQGPNSDLNRIKHRCDVIAERASEVNMPYLHATNRYLRLKTIADMVEDLNALLARQLPLAHRDSEADRQQPNEQNPSNGAD